MKLVKDEYEWFNNSYIRIFKKQQQQIDYLKNENEIMQAYLLGRQDKEDINKDAKGKVLLDSINSTSALKGEEELKNIRLRIDGRYEWRRQIKSIKYSLINKNKKILEKKVRDLLKKTISTSPKIEIKKTFLDIAWQWHNLYKKNLI